MLGLLLKDLFNIRKQALWYAAMIVIFCVISAVLQNVAFASTIGILVTISISLTAIAYEEKDGWQKFVVASGTSIKTIVGEKYFLGVLFALVSSVGYCIIFVIVGVETNRLFELVTPICMQFIALAFVLPIVFKFGVEKGRVYMIIIAVALLAALIGLMPLLDGVMSSGQTIIAICVACATVLLLIISFVISVKIYSKKEF